MTLDRPTRISANAAVLMAGSWLPEVRDFALQPKEAVALALEVEQAALDAIRPKEVPVTPLHDLEDDVTPEQRRSA